MSPFARTAVIVAGALAAVGCLTAAASSTSAPSVATGVTTVSVSPTQAPMQHPVTVTVAFCVAAGTGTTSSVSLTVPAALTPLTSGFALDNTQGREVAAGKVVGQAVTISASPAVASGASVCGHVSFPAGIRATHVVANKATTLEFSSAGTSYPVAFTAVQTLGATPTEPITYGIWTNPADQGRVTRTAALTWYLESGRAAQPYGDSSVTFLDTPQAGQTVVCKSARVEIGTLDRYNDFVFVSSYTGQLSTECAASRLRVVIGALDPGTVARLVLQTTPAAKAPTSFGNTGSVSVNGAAGWSIKAKPVVHYRAVGAVTVKAQAAGTSPSASTSSAPSRLSTTAAANTHSESSGPSGPAVALLVGLGVVAIGMIGVALKRRQTGAAS